MARRGQGYGSEDNLLRYRSERPDALDAAIRSAVSGHGAIEWLYPGSAPEEPKDLAFVALTPRQADAWKRFWPAPGNRSWDGVAQSGGEWVLLEAKANSGEFNSPACAASPRSLAKITKALDRVKLHCGADPAASWTGTYYQYANRLAALYFLNVVARIPAHLVFLYFYGDIFPDGRECPESPEKWKALNRHCHQALGLPEHHALSGRCHDVFLPALGKAS